MALLQDTVHTDLKHITGSAQMLEVKILKCYPEKIKIEKSKTRKGNTDLAVRYQLKKHVELNIVK